MFRSFAEFVSMHYALSDRVDTEYWKDIQKRNYPIEEKFFDEKSDFQLAYKNKMEDHYFHSVGGFPCIAMGMDWHPTTLETIQHSECNPNIYSYKKKYKVFADYLDNRKKEFEKIADYSPTLYDYLKENIYNDKIYNK